MLRQILVSNNSSEFRLRGKEPGRLENFSDAVFALAITLLLISTSPPTSFEQIKRFALDVIPFSMCITLIILIWHEHYVFFARYGLRSGKVVALNTLFLVIVLFYVYPLKFLTKLSLFIIAYFFEVDWLWETLQSMIHKEDIADLMIIYGIGASSIFFTLMLMYRLAYKNADTLELTEIEKFDTRVSIRTNLLMALVPLSSVLIAFILKPHWTAGMISGFVYFLYSPIMFIHFKRVDRHRKKLSSQPGDTVQIENHDLVSSPSMNEQND
jgi:uncharacterized membrane protein